MTDKEFLFYFGKSVKKYRTIAGISQERLSDRMDCDKNTIGRIERGETNPRLSTLRHLSLGLGTTCTHLLRDAETLTSDYYAATHEYDFLRLFEYCKHLSPEQLNNICSTAQLYANSNQKLTGREPHLPVKPSQK